MKWKFRKYFYVLLASQIVVFFIMMVIASIRVNSFSDQSMKILQEKSYHAMENELRTRVELVISHIESEMGQAINEVKKIAKMNSSRISQIYKRGGIDAVNDYINDRLPEIHSTLYGHALEIIIFNSKTGSLERYLGHGNMQDLNKMFSSDSVKEYVREAAVCETLQLGDFNIYLYSNQSIINMVVKDYVYNIIHTATYGENGYTWVNEVLNYEGGENYAIRLIHPNLKDTEGIFLSTLEEDKIGNLPYLNELIGIKENGEIVHRYYFEAKDGSGISEKISYAKLYKPFDWIIATGEQISTVEANAYYLSDINVELLETMLHETMIVLLLVLFFGFIIIYSVQYIGQNEIETFIENEVSFDDLTGLYNRKYFYEAANNLIKKCKGKAYIVRVNVCNFEVVNDLYGIEKGDQLLREIANNLQKMKKNTV